MHRNGKYKFFTELRCDDVKKFRIVNLIKLNRIVKGGGVFGEF